MNPFCTAVNPGRGTRLSQSGDVNNGENGMAAMFGQSGQNSQDRRIHEQKDLPQDDDPE